MPSEHLSASELVGLLIFGDDVTLGSQNEKPPSRKSGRREKPAMF